MKQMKKNMLDLPSTRMNQDSMESIQGVFSIDHMFHQPPVNSLGQCSISVKTQDVSGLEESWLRRWSQVLEKDGLPCTKAIRRFLGLVVSDNPEES